MNAPGNAGASHEHAEFNVDSFLVAGKKGLTQHALGELQAVDQKLRAVKDSAAMAGVFEEYAQVWKEHRNLPLAAYYYSLAAKLENSEKKLTFAAQLFLDLARNEHSGDLQHWEAESAVAAFDQSLKINPDNDTVRLGLAECYFGTGEAMKGVAVIKEITKKDPEHTAANLLLGQQGLISQQFAKAQQRFETVLKKEPSNLEAMLGLAEAYRGQGQNGKAVSLLQECKKQIKNPAFAQDIDNYIKSIQ
ncbi:MAG: tetratricopeptide repeat protein [Chitinophagaceae bacterium]|nr:tetratricopeptide repeat protein [Chitinophagaceae bacterium]